MIEAKTEGFRVLPSYFEVMRDLPNKERLKLYDAIFDCGFGYEAEELPPPLDRLFSLMKPNIESSVSFYIKQVQNGGKGGRPSKTDKNPDKNPPKNPDKNPNENRDSDSDSDSDSESEGDSDNYRESKERADKPLRSPRFTPPSVNEIAAYCRERGNNVDPEQFHDFYSSKGWKVGSQPMKDWKAAVRTWEHRQDQRQGGQEKSGNVFVELMREAAETAGDCGL